MTDEQMRTLLQSVRVIAVVGLSPKSTRPSYRVAEAMQEFSYQIVPVRPAVNTILNEKVYANLRDIPFSIDLVNVFRAAEHVPEIIDTCIELGVKAVWLQEGIVHAQAAEAARKAGMQIVMDRCIYKDYLRLGLND